MVPEIKTSLAYLASHAALESISRDPYWPKWNSPWWHMCLLNELGLAREIPSAVISEMVEVLKSYYLPIFPIQPDELPPGTDPYRKIACFCAVGNMYQVLFNAGVDVDSELPWMREWFLKYPLPDGGLNCDEKAYLKPHPKSSIVSTVACLEAILFCTKRDLLPSEVEFLNRGAAYLIKHRLFRRASNGEVINPDWLEVRFPRFYEYDFLRGFYFLEKWRAKSGFLIPDELCDEVEQLVAQHMSPEGIKLKRYNDFEKRSYNPSSDGSWSFGSPSEFALMKAVSFAGATCPALTEKWNEVRPKTAVVIKSYETVYKNPIKLVAGETVKVLRRESNPDWLGWVYCVDPRGVEGWVSEKLLAETGSTAVATRDYDATELSAHEGEALKVYYEELGWCWGKNSVGARGWIPKQNLKLIN